MRLFLDTPSWYYSRRCTDWSMKLEMASEVSSGNCAIVSNFLFVLFYNLQFLSAHIFSGRALFHFERFCTRARAFVLGMMGCDVLISQGATPPLLRHGKVLWETYFMDGQLGESNEDFRRGGSDYWLQRMEEFGPRVDRIAVRGTHSVDLVKKMYPEFAEKVIDLGFIHQEYPISSVGDIIEKQNDESAPASLLFIGRQARLKGLEPLLSACKIMRGDGCENFKLTVVSTLSDGNVAIPDEEWIRYYYEVSHDRALELMRNTQIFVMPTFRDSYGLVFHEAMASGCVTVVPDREPQKEFVDYGRAGVVIDPRSPRNIANALRPLIENSMRRKELALKGRERFLACYSQEVIRKSWHEAINALEK